MVSSWENPLNCTLAEDAENIVEPLNLYSFKELVVLQSVLSLLQPDISSMHRFKIVLKLKKIISFKKYFFYPYSALTTAF